MYKEAYHLMKHNVKVYKEQMLEKQQRWDEERSQLEDELRQLAQKLGSAERMVAAIEKQSRSKLQALEQHQQRLRDKELEISGLRKGHVYCVKAEDTRTYRKDLAEDPRAYRKDLLEDPPRAYRKDPLEDPHKAYRKDPLEDPPRAYRKDPLEDPRAYRKDPLEDPRAYRKDPAEDPPRAHRKDPLEDPRAHRKERGPDRSGGHLEVLATLLHKLRGAPQASQALLSILQSLLMLGPERGHVWQALDALAVRAILLPQDCPADARHQDDQLEVFAALVTRLSGSDASLRLLSIQQTLLLLGPERCNVWQALETLAVRAVWLPQESQSESSDRILQRLMVPKGGAMADQATQTEGPRTAVAGASVSQPGQKLQTPGRPGAITGLSAPGLAPPGARLALPREVSGDKPAADPADKHKKPDGERKPLVPPPPVPPLSRHPPPPPPPPPPPGGRRRPHSRSAESPGKAGRYPSKKMKKLNWHKLSTVSMNEDQSMWFQKDHPLLELNYNSIEALFGLRAAEQKEKRNPAPRREDKITFICNDKMQNLSILLKQFKCTHEHLVLSIQKGDRTHFDVEVLKELLKLLPQKSEIESLRSYQGDADKLSNVDRFYSSLVAVPCYELRIECMLVCEETASMVDMLTPKAVLLDDACRSVRESHLLARFCKFVLDVGNFLNYESHLGNAEGFRINSLLTLTETKSNQNTVSLLHYILDELELNQPELLALTDDIEICEKAAGVNFKHCQSETSALLKRLKDTANVVSNSVEDVTEQYAVVIKESLQACKALDEKLCEVEQKRRDLAAYLLEDASQLSLEDLFTTMKTFRTQLLTAANDNKQRKEKAAKAEKKKVEDSKTRQKPESRKRTKEAVSGGGFVRDDLLADIRRGFNLKKARPRCSFPN